MTEYIKFAFALIAWVYSIAYGGKYIAYLFNERESGMDRGVVFAGAICITYLLWYYGLV